MKKAIIVLLCSLLWLGGYAQMQRITGVVGASDDPEPVIGANIVVKGTTRGTVTDFNGNFELEAKVGEVLQVSYIGYAEQEVKVTSTAPLRITLQPDNQMLEEVVAIGYGVMKKSDLTGAVTSVKADQLTKTPAAGLDQALQGRAAGVTVTQNSGQPGAAATVRIRGIGSALGGNDPLYVVDGVITSNIAFLSTNDIQSMEILKDASATAIYGSRGANGVILITTKSGGQGKANISFDAYWGIQNRWKKLNLMGANDMARYKLVISTMKNGFSAAEELENYLTNGLDAYVKAHNGTSSYFPTNYDYGASSTDWQDEVFNPNAFMQNYNLSIDGGNDRGHYAFSTSYFSQKGTIIGSNYKRFTIRLNSDFKVRDWWTIGEHFSFMTSTGRNAMNNSSSAGASVISAALAMAPWDPTHYPDGSVNAKGDDLSGRIAASSNFSNVTNPFTMLEESDPEDKVNRFVADLYTQFVPVKGLTIKSSISMDYSINHSRTFKDKYDYSSYDQTLKNYISHSLYNYNTLLEETTITYDREIGKHHFSVMAGQTWQLYKYYGMGGAGSAILDSSETNWYLNKATEDRTYASDGVGRERRLAFLGRAFYSYDGRYMITANFRADASSKFRKNPWGFFPSVALAWRLSEEHFIKDKDLWWFDNLKVRAGWGQVGNDGVGNDSFVTTMTSLGDVFTSYPLGNPAVANWGAYVTRMADTEGKWETNQQWDAGIDFGFWHGMLSGSIDFFLRDTKDALLNVNAPAQVGNRFPMVRNVGVIRNTGVELALEHAHKVKNFSYNIGVNFSWIKNELVELNGGSRLPGDKVMTDLGLALNTFWGYKYLGIYQTDYEAYDYLHNNHTVTLASLKARAGDAKYEDLDGNGIINDDDMQELGNPFPKFTFGLNFGCEFYGVDVQMFFQGVAGNKIFNAVRMRTEGAGDECTLSTDMTDVWIGFDDVAKNALQRVGLNPDDFENRNGSIPNPLGASSNFYDSDRFIESGSYLRLKNLQIGYTLPKKVTEKFHCSRLRFYASATNLFTITKYSGYDPEVGGGVDYGNYPQSRTFTFGLNVNF